MRLAGVVRLAAAFAASAFARAGGGGHYSGGGFGGGGYSGGGGSGGGGLAGDLIYLLFRLVVAYPAVGIPLALVVLYCFWYASTHGDVMFVGEERMHRTIADAALAKEGLRREEGFARLKARDPGFDPDAFLRRASAAFLKVQEAWSGGDMSPARAFVSDGVMERFTLQLAMLKADGKRNVLSDARVLEARVAEVESDRHFDTVHVAVSASAVDKEVALADGRTLFGDDSPESFVEVWSFLRRPGALTLAKPGLIEGFCPSCGAPLELADAARCPGCKSWVNSGQYDWVLCEITQESEWSPRGSGERVPGYAQLAAADPELDTQFLEDRASVVFWRWQRALALRGAASLRGVAVDECCRAFEADAAARPRCYRDAAVGACEVQAFDADAGFERAHVLFKWSGTAWDLSGAAPREGGAQVLSHVIVMVRKAGAKTDAQAGLSSAACPSCGAPPAGPDQEKCEYCGAPFNDGSRQWVALEIAPAGTWRRPSAAPAPEVGDDWTSGLAPADVLALLAIEMTTDGRFDPREKALLGSYAQSRSLPPGSVDAVLEAARLGQLHMPTPQDPAQARACLRGLARMSLADGMVSDEEVRLMTAYARHYGMDEGDVWKVVKTERAALYREGKGVLKEAAAGQRAG